MNRYTGSYVLKFLAVLLISALFLTLSLGVLGFVLAQSEGYYDGCIPRPEQKIAWQLIYTYRLKFPYLALLSLVLFSGLLFFLLFSAGKRRGEAEIRGSFLDRLPLDVYLLGMGGLFFLSCSLLVVCAEELNSSLPYFPTICSVFFYLLSFLLLLFTLMGLCVRARLGNFFQNSLTFKLLSLFLRLIKRFFGFLKKLAGSLFRSFRDSFHAIPLLWKHALLYAGALLLLLFLSVNCQQSGMAALLLLLYLFFLFLALLALSLQMQKLKRAGERLAAGDLQYRTDTRNMYFDFKRHGENLNCISLGMGRALEERMKSERLKTELITNVSHDLKTPLTSIVNYTDLLEKEELPEKAKEYASVLSRQAQRLKKLTEDLFYAAKTQAGAIAVDMEKTDLSELCDQALAEYGERFLQRELQLLYTPPKRPVFGLLDGKLLWRVLDNLFSNVCKYAQRATRVYLELHSDGRIVLKNISENILNIPAEELMERFVRGDSARSSEGSGLGLNIAKSLMEQMGGRLELSIDGDLFKVTLFVRKAE